MENRAALRGQGGVDSAAKTPSPAGGVHTLLATIPQGRISLGFFPRELRVENHKGQKVHRGFIYNGLYFIPPLWPWCFFAEMMG